MGLAAGIGAEHIAPRRGRDRDRVAAGDGHRPQLFQGVPAEQAGGAEQLGHRRIGAVHLDRERRGTAYGRRHADRAVRGDELGRIQQGNNNAYCRDNEITWVDWANADTPLLEFTQTLIAFRRAHPVFRRRRFLAGTEASELQWFTPRAPR